MQIRNLLGLDRRIASRPHAIDSTVAVTSAPRSSLRAGANFRSRAKPAQDLKWRPIPPIAVRLPRLLATAATAARSALDRVWHALVDNLASCYVPWSVGGELGKDVAASDGRGRCWVVSNLHESNPPR
jgi:hypothetical protein